MVLFLVKRITPISTGFCRSSNSFRLVACGILVMALMFSSTLPSFAAGYPRTLTLETRDTQVQLDQWSLRLDQPLVWVENQPYIPALELGAFLGITLQFDAVEGWLQVNTDDLLQQPGINPLAGELARTAYEKAGLEQLHRELERQLRDAETASTVRVEASRYEAGSLGELESFLNDSFGWLRGIPIAVRASHSGTSGLRLTLTLDEADRRDFERLSRTTVSSYLSDLTDATLTIYPSRSEIRGALRSENSTTRTLVDFELLAEDTRPEVNFRYTPSSSTSGNRTWDHWQDWDHQWQEWTRSTTPADTPTPDPSPVQPVEPFRQHAAVTRYPLKLTVDGVPFHSRNEIFVWQGVLYAPLYELADALYLMVYLDNEANTLKLNSNPAAQSHTFPTMLLQLDNTRKEIAELQASVETLEQQLSESMVRQEQTAGYIPFRRITTVAAMERYLEDYYDSLDRVPAWMSLSRISGSRYRLRISYDAEDFDWFDTIPQQRIERWVIDMQAAIRELYDAEATVEGWIRSTPFQRDDYTHIYFDPRDRDQASTELRFDFGDHGGSGVRQLVDAAEVQRHLRRNLGRFRGLTFTYNAEMIRRDVELTVITNESRFSRLSARVKGEYLQELRDELEDLYPGIRVDGFITNTQEGVPYYRFSLENGEIRSYNLMEDLSRELNRDESSYNDLRFNFSVREDGEGSVLVKLEGDFAASDSSWQEVNVADFTSWAEDLFERSAEILGRSVTGQVTDRLNETLLLRRINE